MRTTYKALCKSYDVLSRSLYDYSQAIGERKDNEVDYVKKALRALDTLLLAKPRKGPAERMYPTAHSLADQAREIIKAHGPETVAQSIKSHEERKAHAAARRQDPNYDASYGFVVEDVQANAAPVLHGFGPVVEVFDCEAHYYQTVTDETALWQDRVDVAVSLVASGWDADDVYGMLVEPGDAPVDLESFEADAEYAAATM